MGGAKAEHEKTLEAYNRLIAMEKIHETDELLRTLLNANPFGANFWSKDMELIDINEATVHLFKLSSKRDYIDNFWDFSPEYQPDGRLSRDAAALYFQNAFETGGEHFEWMHRSLDGENIPCEVTIVRVDYKGDHILAVFLRDLREHKRMMADIEKQKQLAETANQAKSSFLSTMSHEIRTPMNAILGITEIHLHSDGLDPHVREGFEKIHTSGDMLLGIINDILDLSKIEAGKLELLISKYETASLISDTAQLNMMRIGSKPIEFELYVDESIPAALLGDELRVKQILNNILSNAFKYTQQGMVRMSVASKRIIGLSNKTMLVVRISDTGQGMTKEEVDKLFDDYSRFNQESNRSTEGTGLVMSITRNLIRMMHGELTIESRPGKGSIFTVYIPQEMVDSSVLGKEIAENLHQFRTSSRAQMRRIQIKREPMPYGSVLIVDDVESNIFVARGLMTPYELSVDSADSGFSAIDKIKSGKAYDIIFMDHMMPVMDGVEVTRRLREMGYDRPIVALTANAVSGQQDVFLKNGFDDFISKPIDIRKLDAVLNRLVRDKQPRGVVEEARSHAIDHKKPPVKPSSNAVPKINPRFAEVFARDANRTMSALEAILEKGNSLNEADVKSYVIYTHGIKSALASIGILDLSAIALRLEQIGLNNNIERIIAETPGFLELLRDCVINLLPKDESSAASATDEDTPYFKERLN